MLHRHNLAHVGTIIEIALEMGAEYLELANTQYYGWAWENRLALMPTQEQLHEAEAAVQDWRAPLRNRCQILRRAAAATARAGRWRLPVPGLLADRRSGTHRPRLRPRPGARPAAAGGVAGPHRAAR